MKKIVVLLLALISFGTLKAQEDIAPSTFSLALNHDNAFGFAPAAFGSLGLNKDVSLTYYGIFWTNFAYSNSGFDSWLETGIGVSFPAFDGKALINPSIGLTHGSLLSGSASGEIAEGIVPNVAIFYTGEYTELEVYAGYYKAIKDGGFQSDFLLYWFYPGLRLTESISAGLHYEQFYLTNDSNGTSESFYQWVGGYVKFITNGQYSFRFSAGRNINGIPDYSDSFYKLSVFMPM